MAKSLLIAPLSFLLTPTNISRYNASVTPKQMQLLRFIRNSIVHERRKPTFREMRDYMGVSSNQTLIDWIVALEKQNYLIWKKGEVHGVNLKEKISQKKDEPSLKKMSRKKDPGEFSQKIVDILAKRAAQTCSNPQCRRPTSGPHSEKDKSVIVGKAAHIKGQRPGSARYDATMTDEQRGDISNGIWLCGVCHDAVDKDEAKYTVEVLQAWRREHENEVNKAILSSLGLRHETPITATVKADVLEDENIKKAIQAWGKGDIINAFQYSQDAYYTSSGEVKLQAIVNMILLSHDQLQRASYYISLCNEGIALADSLSDLSTMAVLKAHKSYYLQNRAFSNSLEVYKETQTRRLVGFPTMTNVELNRLIEVVKQDATEIDRLVNEAQTDAYNTRSYSTLAHVKMTIGNVVGMTYFFTKHLGEDTGQIEHLTIRALTEAKEIYAKLEDKEGIGNALHNLANNLRFFGDVERAKRCAAGALKIAKEIGYKELEMKATQLLEDRLKGNDEKSS